MCDFVSAAYLNVPVKPQQKVAPVVTQEIFDEEEKGFEVVEESAAIIKKKQYQKGGQQGTYQPGAGRGRGTFVRGGYQGKNAKFWQNRNQADVNGYIHQLGKKGFREPSIDVKGDWPVIIELSKNQLEKLNPVSATLLSTPVQCGEVYQYNAELDRAGTHKKLPLQDFKGSNYHYVPTLEDPVIKRLATEKKADIFATELAVSALMTAPKSLYSWDIIIKKH